MRKGDPALISTGCGNLSYHVPAVLLTVPIGRIMIFTTKGNQQIYNIFLLSVRGGGVPFILEFVTAK